MHTQEVEEVVRNICAGKMSGPGLAYAAPALDEGIPEFMNKVLDGFGDLATYSALYMGLVATAGFTGYHLRTRGALT